MSRPPLNVGWPMVPVAEDPYVGVEIAPNEIVYVVMRANYDRLLEAHQQLLVEHENLRQAALDQMQAAHDFLDVWKNLGRA